MANSFSINVTNASVILYSFALTFPSSLVAGTKQRVILQQKLCSRWGWRWGGGGIQVTGPIPTHYPEVGALSHLMSEKTRHRG